MGGRAVSEPKPFIDGVCLAELGVGPGDKVGDGVAEVVGWCPKRFAVLSRSKHLMSNSIDPLKAERNTLKTFGDAELISRASETDSTDTLIMSPSIAIGTLASYRHPNWVIITDASDVELLAAFPVLRGVFGTSELVDQVGILLSSIDMCARYWPWDTEGILQYFYRENPLSRERV